MEITPVLKYCSFTCIGRHIRRLKESSANQRDADGDKWVSLRRLRMIKRGHRDTLNQFSVLDRDNGPLRGAPTVNPSVVTYLLHM